MRDLVNIAGWHPWCGTHSRARTTPFSVTTVSCQYS